MNVQVQRPFVPVVEAPEGVARPRRLKRPVPRRIPFDVILPSLMVAVLLLWALVPSWFAPFVPTDMDQTAILQAPSARHLLGADHLGRDVFSLIVYGARQSLLVAAGAVVISLLIGGIFGLIGGYAGGVVDLALMRLIDIWMSVPNVLLVIILATALRPNLHNVILTIGLVLSPHFARVLRAQVIAVRHRPFVEASRSIGASHLRLLFRHILPHTLPQVLVMVTLYVGGAMLLGTLLSFIGLGVVNDRPDWGYLLSQGRSYLTVAWWFATFPGLAITLAVISTNLLGEALRRRLDPRAQLR